jgi:hypothetical protein
MIIQKVVSFGEFLAYQEKYPKVKAIFTVLKYDGTLRVETKGKMSIILDEDKSWN